MSKDLTQFDAARMALAIAKTLDEVKVIHDKSAAIREYARRAQDKQLLIDAAELQVRAERRLGEMLRETARAQGKRTDLNLVVDDDEVKPTLADLGISRDLSSRAQKIAAMAICFCSSGNRKMDLFQGDRKSCFKISHQNLSSSQFL